MESLITTIHYVLCFFLICVILLQTGKGADIGAVFGGASQTVFGGRGPATFLNKITAFVAIGFLITSIWLAHIAKTLSSETIFDKAQASSPLPAAGTKAPSGEGSAARTVKGGDEKAPEKEADTK